jgi:hypothetical protein
MRLLDQFGAPIGGLAELDRFAADAVTVCRGCGCDDDRACIDPRTGAPCSWALQDIAEPSGVCSTCAERAGWHPIALAAIGQPGSIADYVPFGLERYANDLMQDAAA